METSQDQMPDAAALAVRAALLSLGSPVRVFLWVRRVGDEILAAGVLDDGRYFVVGKTLRTFQPNTPEAHALRNRCRWTPQAIEALIAFGWIRPEPKNGRPLSFDAQFQRLLYGLPVRRSKRR